MSDSVRPHRRQPTRLPHPWDSPGKNTGVGLIGQIDFGAVTVVENNACSGVAKGDKQSFGFVGRIIRLIGIQLSADDLVDGKFGTLLTVRNNQSVSYDPFATQVDSIPER